MTEARARRKIVATAGAFVVALGLLGTAAEAGVPANRALSCDGTDDFAIASFAAIPSLTTLTVEVWARPEAFSEFGAVASAQNGFSVLAPGSAGFSIGPGATTTPYGGSLTLGDWVHIAGTYDGTNVRVFVNGQPAASAIKPDSTPVSMADFRVCVWPYGGVFFQGAIDELRIWNVVRTDEEIASHYTESLSGAEPGLLAYYKFDEADGDQTIVDSSPNGRDGTLGADATVAADDPTRIEPGAPLPEPGGAALVALLTIAGLSRAGPPRA
jgi:hypothetical protein